MVVKVTMPISLEDTFRMYAADYEHVSRVTQYAENLLTEATARGIEIDESSFKYGFGEALTFALRYPELAAHYATIMQNSLSPRLNESSGL